MKVHPRNQTQANNRQERHDKLALLLYLLPLGRIGKVCLGTC
ncbi:hypothetical protein Dd1591_1223 [Dickeya chrysanthemi Ech1591]|uniref:Uncharacterized protein n=1 Tax=Dickeya chrysanthemi (strain Ech1591) TaxID=561229 RepID=C6CQ94_DICC1|nr:hypothetical protein Dd1591_1223 [Dickeya chrysanthemi Ech1591]